MTYHKQKEDGTYIADDVPMIPCVNEFMSEAMQNSFYPGTFYCPEWDENHYL